MNATAWRWLPNSKSHRHVTQSGGVWQTETGPPKTAGRSFAPAPRSSGAGFQPAEGAGKPLACRGCENEGRRQPERLWHRGKPEAYPTIRGDDAKMRPKPPPRRLAERIPSVHELRERRKQLRLSRQMRPAAGALHQTEARPVGRAVRHAGVGATYRELPFRRLNRRSLAAVHLVFPPDQTGRGEPIAQLGNELWRAIGPYLWKTCRIVAR